MTDSIKKLRDSQLVEGGEGGDKAIKGHDLLRSTEFGDIMSKAGPPGSREFALTVCRSITFARRLYVIQFRNDQLEIQITFGCL